MFRTDYNHKLVTKGNSAHAGMPTSRFSATTISRIWKELLERPPATARSDRVASNLFMEGDIAPINGDLTLDERYKPAMTYIDPEVARGSACTGPAAGGRRRRARTGE